MSSTITRVTPKFFREPKHDTLRGSVIQNMVNMIPRDKGGTPRNSQNEHGYLSKNTHFPAPSKRTCIFYKNTEFSSEHQIFISSSPLFPNFPSTPPSIHILKGFLCFDYKCYLSVCQLKEIHCYNIARPMWLFLSCS